MIIWHRLPRLCPLLLALVAAPAGAMTLRISELLYDAEGADDGRVFVELHGPGGLDLEGFTLEGVNGSDGRVGPVLSLSGLLPEDGFFVIADTAGGTSEIAGANLLLDFDFQNGPDSVVLRGAGGELLDALGYGSFGPDDVFAGEGSPAPDAPSGHSLARRFADLDTDDNAADFEVLETPTPGSGVLVPEPGAGPLLGVALLGLAAFRRLRSSPPRVAP
jgi:hypothetical protein